MADVIFGGNERRLDLESREKISLAIDEIKARVHHELAKENEIKINDLQLQLRNQKTMANGKFIAGLLLGAILALSFIAVAKAALV